MLWFKSWGNPSHPAFVFLHGFMGSHLDFLPVIEILQKEFYCLAIDLPGHGNSSPFIPQNIEEFDDIVTLTIQKNISSPFHLVGYSMGGRVALKLSSRLQPSMLSLISSKVFPLNEKEQLVKIAHELDLTQQLENDSFINFLKIWYSHPIFKSLTIDSKEYDQMLSQRKKQSPAALAQILKLTSPVYYSHQIATLKCPLLYVAGYQDKKYIQELAKVKRYYPKAWLSTFSNCSHALHIEKPHTLTYTLKQFQRFYYDPMATTASV